MITQFTLFLAAIAAVLVAGLAVELARSWGLIVLGAVAAVAAYAAGRRARRRDSAEHALPAPEPPQDAGDAEMPGTGRQARVVQPGAARDPLPEDWRVIDVPGWHWPYEVEVNEGRVRSLPRQTRAGLRGGVELRPSPDGHGYPRVTLRDGPRMKTAKVHVLVMLLTEGPCPPGLEIAHGRLGQGFAGRRNLRYTDHGDNERDKTRWMGRGIEGGEKGTKSG